MRQVMTLLLSVCMTLPLWSHAQTAAPEQQITDLDQLLASVREQHREQRARNKQREQQFLRDKKQQQALLSKARQDFDRRKKENQPLFAVTEGNKAEIARLEQQLKTVVQDMGDLSSTFREFAGDFSAVLQESMITAQFPERGEQLRALAATDTQPTIDEIETLWLLLQEEMTEAGKVTVFEAPVVTSDGKGVQRSVLRVGAFSAYADGDFLRYVPETGELLVLSRQPGARYRSAARDFVSHAGTVAPITVDPTRGSLLGMLSYSPSLRERIEQGGIIALIIIALGAVGLLMACWRGLYLGVVSLRIKSQLADMAAPRPSNPLGRVLLAVQGIALDEEELLQLKLDEAVLVEMPALERGNAIIKLLAAISPLLGLLGTVTGMILTFQAISLFGTSDPKLMAGGISQALVTTVLGLMVAIPLLFSHAAIAYMSRGMIQRLDEQCAGVLVRTAEQQGKA
ncbi:MAG: MotA/TolQ/ExbB proton channel family protein [Gammaproteobacteria bacterium]|nr:MAG: MotA/TolQ/ExbB proton channel family protein [Gammaproteobacteria bacterium]RLA56974.1 MAG: MotA/TolQ/ExbB proton channel family protein [Gammaproteobacteria bacterium]